jgi:hypothetical protein
MQLSIPKLGFPTFCKNFLPVAVSALLLVKFIDEKDARVSIYYLFVFRC